MHAPCRYRYDYNATVPGDGVNHGGELDAVWHRNTAFASEDAQAVSAAMGEYWASFVATGTPQFRRPRKDWPSAWTPFRDSDAERFLNVSGGPTASDGGVDAVGGGGGGGGGWAGAEVSKDLSGYSGLYAADACKAWEDYVRLGPAQAANFNTFGYLC
jgi:hypothetical protein